MTRHRLDWLSLLVGLLAVGVAVSALTDLDLSAITVAAGPAVAVAAGLALLVAAVRSSREQRANAPGTAARTPPPTDLRSEPGPSLERARPAGPQSTPEPPDADTDTDAERGATSAAEAEVTRRLPVDNRSAPPADGDTDRLDQARDDESP